MKRVIWGGFCLIAGILMMWMAEKEAFYPYVIDNTLTLLAIALIIYGFITGIIGLRRD